MNNGNRKSDMNLVKLIQRFHGGGKCIDYLEKLRWPDGIACTRCGSQSISRLSKRYQFDCNDCRYQFSATSGTAFHDTHLPLWKWFLAIYMMVEAKKGISANQLKRTLDVSYKTAWYLCHRVRNAMKEAYPYPLKGIVEVDETYVGGTTKGTGHGYKGNKSLVVGAVQRGGKIVLQVVTSKDRKTLHKFIKEHTHPDAEAIYTDDWPSYKGIGDSNTKHEVVNHSLNEWKRGDVHTNSIENIWSLLKRSIMGSYHKISIKHLDAYLDELEWRFNNRDNPYLFNETLGKLINSNNVTYQELTT